jgi:hypothetical protein
VGLEGRLQTECIAYNADANDFSISRRYDGPFFVRDRPFRVPKKPRYEKGQSQENPGPKRETQSGKIDGHKGRPSNKRDPFRSDGKAPFTSGLMMQRGVHAESVSMLFLD